MRVLVTGATGFVGRALIAHLRERGDAITVISRDAARAKQLGDVTIVQAELEAPGAWWDALAEVDAIVHLAGEPIGAKRWDARRKQLIRDSRVETTRAIVEAIAKAQPRPRVLVTASGVDYYPFAIGHTEFDDDEVTEADPPADTFLGRVCRDWEAQAREAEKLGVRVVAMRTGLVLGPGGALEQLARPFRRFAGGKIGTGQQWMSWIHLADVVAAYAAAISDDRYAGAINVVTASVRNRDFAAALGNALHRPSWLRVPAFALRAAVGELAESILEGRNVVPKRLRELGFVWRYARLERALGDALGLHSDTRDVAG